MNRKLLAALLVGVMLVLAGCAGGTTEEQQDTAKDSLENNTFTFTKQAEQTDKVWTCIGHEKYTGSAGDEELQCELVDVEGEGY